MPDLDYHRINAQFVGERVRVIRDDNDLRPSILGEEGEVVGYSESNGSHSIVVDIFIPEGHCRLFARPDMLRIV